MITDTDLKIHNHVAVKGDAGIYSVEGIRLAFFHPMKETEVLLDRPHGSHEPVRINRLKGVPLTELAVKKLGFLFGGAHYFHPVNPYFFIWNFSKGKKNLWKVITHHVHIGDKISDTPHRVFQYVHELQNYFYEDNKVMLRFDDYNMNDK